MAHHSTLLHLQILSLPWAKAMLESGVMLLPNGGKHPLTSGVSFHHERASERPIHGWGAHDTVGPRPLIRL